MSFFHHKDLGNHFLQLCPKVVKHPVYYFTEEGIYYDVFRGRISFMWSEILTLIYAEIIIMDSVHLGSDAVALGT